MLRSMHLGRVDDLPSNESLEGLPRVSDQIGQRHSRHYRFSSSVSRSLILLLILQHSEMQTSLKRKVS